MIYSISAIYQKKYSHHSEKKPMETRIIKMKEDFLGMSNPKQHANKVGKLT